MRIPLFFLAAAAMLGGGCGPFMIQREIHRQSFVVEEPCTQGPLEIRLKARGARWGEQVRVDALSPRALGGRYSLRAPGTTFDGRYGSDRPDNARCVASADEMAAAAPAAPAGAGPPGAPVAPLGPSARRDEGPPAAPRLVPISDEPPATLQRIAVLSYSWPNEDPAAPPPLREGGEIVLRLWSPEPNDLRDVRLVVTHEMFAPSGSEEEWIAAYRRRQEKAREEERKRQARYAAEQERRIRFCHAHPMDEGCWGRGGLPARQAEALRPRPPAPMGPPAPPPAIVEAPRPRDADRPPPPPRAQVPPPRPSEHAEWVPGYWRWGGFDYGWIGGFWRVPEADRLARRTATAPTPPPPPPREVPPPPPAPQAVWTAGYWAWGPQGYVWIEGSWQIPPQVGLVWRPARWLLEGLGARLDPGGWTGR